MGCMKSTLEDLGVEANQESYDSIIRWHFSNEDTKLIGKKESY